MTRATSTSEMEVTKIRLERKLKEKLKALAGDQDYQTLIRDILWRYVNHNAGEVRPPLRDVEIRATLAAIAQKEETCVLTGKRIQAGESLLLGLTIHGDFVPLSPANVIADP
ncbi:hypothetical protein FLX56_22655 [Synechococcus moorigangaii CMS01]|nr:hypothetical protein [Synechococcus moorigangaii CMS01]